VFSNNRALLYLVCVSGSGFDGEWQKIKPLKLIRTIAFHGQSLLCSAGGPRPLPAITKKWHSDQGQAAKAVVKKCISLWAGSPLSQMDHFIVTGGSKR